MCDDEGHRLLKVQNRILAEHVGRLFRELTEARARTVAPRQPGHSTPYCPPAPPLRRIQ